MPHVRPPHFAAEPNPGRGAAAPKRWAANSTGDETTRSRLLCPCTHSTAANMCEPVTDTLFLYAQYQLSIYFNRIEDTEPKEETEELRKAQEDAKAAASRAGMG